MRNIPALLAAATALVMTSAHSRDGAPMTFQTLAPIIFVETIEPCLPFWTEHLGWSRALEVPEGDGLGFVAVQHDGLQVMYQTYASVEADLPPFASFARQQQSTLYLRVSNVEDLARELERADGVDVVHPLRETFSGARELWVRAPCGTVIGFAEFAEQ